MGDDSVTTVLAVVAGRPLTEIPNDLFIPPDALEILLDSFSGPLDLLLYLIRQQDIDIMNIPMAMITQQYMQYIDLLEVRRMELAADYLVMAALLIEIKSKLLLPSKVIQEDDSEEDPRMELVRRLQTYEHFKQLALLIDQLPRFEREVFQVKIKMGDIIQTKIYPEVELSSIVLAIERVLQHKQCLNPHQVTREPLSVRERMNTIIQYFEHHSLIEFTRLLTPDEGRMGLVVTLLAILELARQSLVTITQTDAFSVIHLQANQHG